jgi:hypothetical protein
MSAWIPAVHAGMTQSRKLCSERPKSLCPLIFKGGHEGHKEAVAEKGSQLKKIFSSFVFFVRFVVSHSFFVVVRCARMVKVRTLVCNVSSHNNNNR